MYSTQFSDSQNVLEQVSFGKSGFNVAVVDAGADLEANQFCYARIYLRCLRRGGHTTIEKVFHYCASKLQRPT